MVYCIKMINKFINIKIIIELSYKEINQNF